MSSTHILTSEEDTCLQEAQIVLPASDGKRKVSAAFLSPPSSLSSSSSNAASVSFKDFETLVHGALDMPERFISVATLECMGFTKVAAGTIFDRYSTKGDDNPSTLLQYALAEISRLDEPEFEAAQPGTKMDAVGISPETQAIHLNPQHQHIFNTEPLSVWLSDTVASRYYSLEYQLCRMKQQAQHTLRHKKTFKRPKIIGEGLFDGASDNQSGASSSSFSAPMSATTNLLGDDWYLPRAHVSQVKSRPKLLPGHVMLFKGKAKAEMSPGYGRKQPFILNNGQINMWPLRTLEQGDFNQNQDAWYWAEDIETAEQYRIWAAERNPYGQTWIISIQIPHEFVKGLHQQPVSYSRFWQEYVWSCRMGVGVRMLPSKFDHLWKRGEKDHVLVGPICKFNVDQMAKIEEEDIYTKLTFDDSVLMHKTGGQWKNSVQWVFMHRDVADKLGAAVRGKIHVEVFRPVGAGKLHSGSSG